MSKIDAQILKLREREKQLEQEKLKIEFLNHILKSAESYDHKSFKDIKIEVVGMLRKFVTKAVESIENGVPLSFSEPPKEAQSNTVFAQENPNTPPRPAPPKREVAPGELSPSEKMAFAMANRHLAGRDVTVANDKNLTITGKVVGLDAPFVVVKTETGPTIKVPLDQVSIA
jgi:hypothetical protein